MGAGARRTTAKLLNARQALRKAGRCGSRPPAGRCSNEPHEMLTLLEEELMRRLCETVGLGLVRHTSSVIAATSGAVAIGDLSVAAGVSSPHLAQRFKGLIGVTPKRLTRTYRFAATVFAINPAGPVDWGDLAGGAGYFDQAHFGHEFRAFTGLTPTRYVEGRCQVEWWPSQAA
ncbi:AraC family transcriptional regulator [Streptomyces sp. NBC_01669]|uniref:helix-turn-helix domain-containing protein n=1 Tax=Streptomyces sp. NBC_01669 TaxID=2975909 RepID=UPI00225808F4|nr:AraC family transcriptional regulator [Streptomyces sp. NBC_01669]MCX4538925.1 AraC family transcriptional regulator [Streptomyces sp. NBC_01669]